MDKAAKQRKQLARDGYTITYGWFHDGWFHSDNEREISITSTSRRFLSMRRSLKAKSHQSLTYIRSVFTICWRKIFRNYIRGGRVYFFLQKNILKNPPSSPPPRTRTREVLLWRFVPVPALTLWALLGIGDPW